jgi:hypothetical protein
MIKAGAELDDRAVCRLIEADHYFAIRLPGSPIARHL